VCVCVFIRYLAKIFLELWKKRALGRSKCRSNEC